MSVRITVTTDVELDIATAAKWFSGLSDDEMCKFFVAVSEEVKVWPGIPDNMWYFMGKHLVTCECSTDRAREMIRRWAYWLEHHTDKLSN